MVAYRRTILLLRILHYSTLSRNRSNCWHSARVGGESPHQSSSSILSRRGQRLGSSPISRGRYQAQEPIVSRRLLAAEAQFVHSITGTIQKCHGLRRLVLRTGQKISLLTCGSSRGGVPQGGSACRAERRSADRGRGELLIIYPKKKTGSMPLGNPVARRASAVRRLLRFLKNHRRDSRESPVMLLVHGLERLGEELKGWPGTFRNNCTLLIIQRAS